MHYADITAEITKANRSFTQLAAECRCEVSAITGVVRGTITSRRIARHISELIRKPVSDLWPGKYPTLEIAELRAGRARSRHA